MKRILLFVVTVICVYSCGKDPISKSAESFDNAAVTAWSNTALNLIKTTPGFTPPVTARTLGYFGLTMYEAARPGMMGYASMAGQVTGLDVSSMPVLEEGEYNWPIVTNAAAREILEACLGDAKASNKDVIIDQYYSLNNKLKNGVDRDVVNRSIAYGNKVGKAISAYAASDNQLQCYKTNFPAGYKLETGPGRWVPTSAQKIPLQPYWGSVRTFSSANANISIAPPTAYSTDKSSQFYKEANEVFTTSLTLTEEQKTIAKFWSDDPGITFTPPGHSFAIALQILTDEKANLAKSVETLAKVGMGVHDAFVSCWKVKYDFNLLRPVTYIQNFIDSKYTTLLATPPFPEYTSGHSVQSGATSEILTAIFGDNVSFTDRTYENRTDINGTPRKYASFRAAAQEAAISRLYGGIHYAPAIENGITQGNKIGQNILALKFKN
jgi:hypothetical protein